MKRDSTDSQACRRRERVCRIETRASATGRLSNDSPLVLFRLPPRRRPTRTPRIVRPSRQVGRRSVPPRLLPRFVLLLVLQPSPTRVLLGSAFVGVVLVPLSPLRLGQGLVPSLVLRGLLDKAVLRVHDRPTRRRSGCRRHRFVPGESVRQNVGKTGARENAR